MKSKTVLIADDEPHMRRLLEFTVRKTGHKIVQADSGESALSIIAQQSIDLLLIDYGLPGMNGLQTIMTLRKLDNGAKLPVVLITSRGDTGIRQDAEAADVNAFMTKPFSPVELVELVNRLLAP